MILFWLICAVMLIVALMFVLPPALNADASNAEDANARRDANIAIYRDQLIELEADLRNGIVSQEQYAQDREDIERRLLEDTTTAVKPGKKPKLAATTRKHAYLVGIGLCLVAVIFYLRVGSPDAITKAATGATASPAGSANVPAERSQAQIDANVAALANRLKSNPADVEGWTMLARSYSSMERYGEAAGAYAKVTELSPKDANLLAEYAFVTAMANGQKLEGKPMELIDRALKIDPNNAKALQLSGTAAFEAKNYQKAIELWERVLKQVPPTSDVAQAISQRIEEAKSELSHKEAQETQKH
jgi:cytochrome c-type biogenesis protein CcmH